MSIQPPKCLVHRQFASDNLSGITPEAWEELQRANTGHAPAYGNDEWTARVSDLVREIFETDCDVYFTFNGTAANSLAIASLCQSYHSVICHRYAHVETDECGAPEFFSHGTKVLLGNGKNGKLELDSVKSLVSSRSDIHFPKPRVLSLTQSTEHGTVYSPGELSSLCEYARENDLKVHMDGARFANAVAGSGASPADLSWRSGVDVLCFGGTKLGMPVGDMVVFFDRELSRDFAYRCKQAGQLASKMRFMSAPWLGMLRENTWLKYAAHANRMASMMADELKKLDIAVRYPVQSNAVFADLSPPVCERLRAKGWQFYTFIGEGGARLLCSWDIQESDVKAFIGDVADSIDGTAG